MMTNSRPAPLLRRMVPAGLAFALLGGVAGGCGWFDSPPTDPSIIQAAGALVVGSARHADGSPWGGTEVLAYTFDANQCGSDPTASPKGGMFTQQTGTFRFTVVTPVLQDTDLCIIVRFRGTVAETAVDTFVVGGNVRFKTNVGVEADMDSLRVEMVLP